MTRPSSVAAARTRCTAMARKRPLLNSLLSRRLNFDRVAPLQCLCDLQRLARRIVRAAAVVQAERSTGVGHVYPDTVLCDASDARARHLGVDRRLGARPDLQYPVFAHAAHGV